LSRETAEWLNTQTLIGFAQRRGNAWHYRKALQGREPNHYDGAIPPDDVRRRLFRWEGVYRRVAVEVPATGLDDWTHQDEHGVPMRWAVLDAKRATDRSDRTTGEVFAVVSNDYQLHQYGEWLVDSVETLLQGGLQISSAGLLKRGAIAWVEVSVAENRSTEEGVEYRPNLLATTTMDGGSATIYKRTITDVVCDNTRAAALRESGAELRVRHSKHSDLHIVDARKALQIIESASDAFAAQVSELCRTVVTDAHWDAFLERLVPIDRQRDAKYTLELKKHKRDTLDFLYRNDPRCSPWIGTAHGVVQAVNTWEHHARQPQRKALQDDSAAQNTWRANRNMQQTVDGRFDEIDRTTYQLIRDIVELAA